MWLPLGEDFGDGRVGETDAGCHGVGGVPEAENRNEISEGSWMEPSLRAALGETSAPEIGCRV